jgi:aminoglycoside phosphotransferase (APT) family kinase protein
MDAPSDPAGPGGPPGLDVRRLAAYLDLADPGLLGRVGLARGPLSAEVIAGGKSNLTYRVTGGSAAAVVLRRPPLGHVLPTAHDMAREYRVIAALHPTGFPVPVPLHLCQDPEVIGAPFYLMSYVDGRVLRTDQDIVTLSPQIAQRGSELLVATLAALHTVDPDAIGLADFGRPEGYLQRQVKRWHQQWERSKTRDLPTLDEAVKRLNESIPTPVRSGIVHGDFRLDNVMVNADVSQILAVLDWEMATLGDPLADLGILVVYTELAEAGLSPTQTRFGSAQGFLSGAELVERYARVADLPVDRIGWYVALGYYKLASISEGIHARYLGGKTVGPGFEDMGGRVPALVERALASLDAAA